MKIRLRAYVSRSVIRSLGLMLLVLGAAVPVSAQPPTPDPVSPVSLDGVLARFARIEGLTLHFHEVKHIALLSSPIVTDGSIAYARPSRLARRGGTQTVLIDGTTLRMSDGGHEEHMDLASQPVVRSFVDSFRALLAGDRAALARSYRLTFVNDGAAWTITLTPSGAPLNQFLTSIVFSGDGDALNRMTMNETSGDTTTTTFADVDDHHPFSPAESAQVFALP